MFHLLLERPTLALELADGVQISKSYLSQIESGSRPGSLATLKRIANELELTLDDLV